MRIDGTLTKWNDERGFGFITPPQGGGDKVPGSNGATLRKSGRNIN